MNEQLTEANAADAQPSPADPVTQPTNTEPEAKDAKPAGPSFRELGLIAPIVATVGRQGYESATPIQAAAIGPILAGRDLVGGAPTGTGKTAAFTLPMLQRLAGNAPKGPRAVRGLVLCPTRELATQIGESLSTYGRGLGVRHVTVYGGVGQGKQVRALRQGVDVVVATPGRLMDLMGQGHVDLGRVELFVLDEADRMLDMGFIPAVREIAGELPRDRQTLLFSATVPPTIQKLVNELLTEPERVEIKDTESSTDKIEQGVYFVKKDDKPDLLAHVVREHDVNCGIVFSRTKHGADRVVKQLDRRGIRAVSIHGNKNQNQRQRALDGFKAGKVPILVATDVAARGIDVDGITHVINYDLTHEPETYVHRIGRTGRAGASGVALSFCDQEERTYLRDIQRLLNKELDVRPDHPYPDGQQRVPLAPPPRQGGPRPGGKKKGGKNRRRGGGNPPPTVRTGPAKPAGKKKFRRAAARG